MAAPSMNDKIGGSNQLDIGKCITAPTKDKDWIKKCLVMGLILLIPIVGMLNLNGWMRAIVERRMAGGPDADTLPDADLSYVGAGWRMFLAYLPLVGLVLLFATVGSVVAGTSMAVGGKEGAGETIAILIIATMYLGVLLLSFAMWVVAPAINFLHIVDGEPWASTQFRRIWETMRLGGTQYFLLFLACFIAGMIAQLGVLACYIGMFVTIPFGQAISAVAIAEYAKLVQPPSTSFPLEGGAGGASGQPFGVKL